MFGSDIQSSESQILKCIRSKVKSLTAFTLKEQNWSQDCDF